MNNNLNEEIENLKKWIWGLSKKIDNLTFDDLTCTGTVTAGALSTQTVTADSVAVANSFTIGGQSLLDKIYPVGAIYLSLVKTNPGTFLGGTWDLLPSGKALWTTEAASTGGDVLSAGLPNIKGTFTQLRADSNSGFTCDGVLFKNTISTTNGTGTGAGGKKGTLTFNANAYNSIYKDNSTVQPPAIKIFAWKRTA